MNGFPTNYIPKGSYDQTVYNQSSLNKPPNTDVFKGSGHPFKNEFSIQQQPYVVEPYSRGSTYPIPLLVSQQLYQPSYNTSDNTSHTNNNFELGDPYTPAHGSNLNAPGSNNPKFSFNQLNLIENEISNLFKTVDNETINKSTETITKTHSNILPNDYNNDSNRSIIPLKLDEYKKTPLLDNNIKNMSEYISEYIIYIHSGDRDENAYPNPFNYKVEFNPLNSTRNAYISRVFKNIKYINLRAICVPRKYYIINKQSFLITNPVLDGSAFVSLFTSTTINNSISIPFECIRSKITYLSVSYYFIYYKHIIGTDIYNILTYDVYIDPSLTQRITVNIGAFTNQTLINAFLTGGIIPPGYTIVIDTILNVGYWVVIDKTLNKIKFSYKDDVFFNLINQTFEFEISLTNTIQPNTFQQYLLLQRSLEDDRYLLLNIKEIDSMYEYSTDQDIESSFSLLFPNYVNGDYFYLEPAQSAKIYDHGVLGNINRMTIQFKDSSGNDLNVSYSNLIDYDINTPKDKCICGYNSLTGERVRNYQCYHSYLRHPAFEKLQNILLFKVGVIECKQNIMNF